ncbi:quorum sensing histidine kinase QseC [Otariodibacter oris]|uniref:Sensor protein QseC n=1 Tax=Otariodibacter oris TaxID=1032623 RepID=A0A420XFA6_9PAST|nr:quorum sensing histidine kinase QseC [Otariodibacter oris]QGM81601.1 two-component system sensor histidine kinase QseC [Otariodibacter oris]RKR71213.1 two-component system sensor histidine kinase QseC [Otariodibacter oris]
MQIISQKSLRFRLISIISLTALIIWVVSTTIAWLQARKEINHVFDTQQIIFAQRLASSNLHSLLRETSRPYLKRMSKRLLDKENIDDDALAFAIFTASGKMILSDGRNGDNFIYQNTTGFSESQIQDDDDTWRIFWTPMNDDKRLIVAVGQELDYRKDLTEEIVLSQMWIWFASLPLLIGLIVWLISRELRTINQVSQQVKYRTPEDNSMISTGNLPIEIHPLINGLNQFFQRTSSMLLRERRFTSDAAHELRSPLAALKIQTEVAQIAGEDTALREQALSNLTKGIDRAAQLIEQLLTLSRLDNLESLEGVEDIHWEQLITSLISERYFAAQQRNIELAFNLINKPIIHQGQPLLLSLMLRNLIDNAIKYGREGSMVTVILNTHNLIIEDNGGGVSDDDLDKLGQRFYRPAGQNEKGSGLGLSIVKRIAELHQYHIHLSHHFDSNHNKGLKVTIEW